MKITPELKAIMFGQYMMQPCLMNGGSIVQINGSVIAHILTDSCNYDVILKPLSKISDEDVIWVHDTTHNLHEQRKLYPERIAKTSMSLAEMKLQMNIEFNYWLKNTWVFQYLLSKGYDLPQFILGYKTLREAGLAVYMDLEKNDTTISIPK